MKMQPLSLITYGWQLSKVRILVFYSKQSLIITVSSSPKEDFYFLTSSTVLITFVKSCFQIVVMECYVFLYQNTSVCILTYMQHQYDRFVFVLLQIEVRVCASGAKQSCRGSCTCMQQDVQLFVVNFLTLLAFTDPFIIMSFIIREKLVLLCFIVSIRSKSYF